MSKVSEHLHEFHEAMHQDRTDAIGIHEAALDKAAGIEPAFHKAEIARHSKAQAYHAAKMEECSKAVAADDLLKRDQLQPTRISRVVPDRQPVLRHGMQPLAASARDDHDGLLKVIGADEESMHSEERTLRR